MTLSWFHHPLQRVCRLPSDVVVSEYSIVIIKTVIPHESPRDATLLGAATSNCGEINAHTGGGFSLKRAKRSAGRREYKYFCSAM